MVFKTIIIPILAVLLGLLFFAACLGEKKFENKVLYGAIALILMIMLLLSRTA